ncbi:MAG: glycosyltransferase, partial [Actinomycetota bacterium]|nr:glycosyltransferase [Actinomycetota bacterium]
MRIAFAVNGTRGDVQPAAVLAYRLAERGNDVAMGVPPNMGEAISLPGVEVRRLGPDTRAQLDHVSGVRAAAGRNPLRLQRMLTEVRDLGWAEVVGDMADLVEDADVVVTGFTTEQIAAVYARRAGIPVVSLHHAPIRPNTRVGPLPAFTPQSALGTRAQWALADRALTLATRRRDRALRESLGGVPADGPGWTRVRRSPGVEIQAYDPTFAVRDDPLWDRDSRCRPRPVVGFLDLPDRLRRRMGVQMRGADTADAMSWVDSDDPPVYFGFGSMPLRDPAAVVGVIEQVCRSLGRRGLICAGWNSVDVMASGIGGNSRLLVVDSIDHAVFARCAAIVHHGGAG